MKSLQQQLLNAGLVDKNTARQSAKTKHRQAKVDRKKHIRSDDIGDNAMRDRNAERDRELNKVRQRRLEEKATAAQIRQLVELNQLPVGDGNITFNFVYDNKIKKIEVTDDQRKALTLGRLSIIALTAKNFPQFSLVPRAVAEKIAEKDQSVVVDHADASAGDEDEDEDDSYADYKVPDDMIW